MPVTITINGDSATQAIEEFATLSAAFVGGETAPAAEPVQEEKPKQKSSRKARKEEKQQEVEEEVAEVEESEEDDSEDDGVAPTPEDLRAKAQELKQKDKDIPAKIKPLLEKFGVKNLSSVPENKCAAFMAELEKLG